MGKTAFVLNITDYIAVRRQKTCLIFSLEMSKEQLVNRMLSMESNVDSQKLRTGTLTDSDWDAVVEGIGIIGNSKLIIDDTPGISISELRSKCRKMKLEYGLSIVIIDYLQLMSGSRKGGNDNRQQEISDISRSLKALARELHAPVIALSQLSRAVRHVQTTDLCFPTFESPEPSSRMRTLLCSYIVMIIIIKIRNIQMRPKLLSPNSETALSVL